MNTGAIIGLIFVIFVVFLAATGRLTTVWNAILGK